MQQTDDKQNFNRNTDNSQQQNNNDHKFYEQQQKRKDSFSQEQQQQYPEIKKITSRNDNSSIEDVKAEQLEDQLNKELEQYEKNSQEKDQIDQQKEAPEIGQLMRSISLINKGNNSVFRQQQKKFKDLSEYSALQLNQIKKIQKYYKKRYSNKGAQSLVEIYKKMRKRHRYRMNILKELVNTEESYGNYLKIIIDTVKNPLIQQEIINEVDANIIFSNVEQIYQLNQNFCQKLKERFFDNEKKFGPYTLIADVAIKIVPFFKIYSEYFNNFEKSDQKLKALKETNEKLNEFLSKIERTAALSNNDLEGFLIKPVQRPPKYDLLFKDLLKHTDADHPDYNNVQQAVKKFSEVNNQNNDSMAKAIMNDKLFELQKHFGTKNLSIIEKHRELKFEENLGFFHEKEVVKQCLVYFLSDLVLITEKAKEINLVTKQIFQQNENEQYKLLNFLYLNDESFVKNFNDLKYYSHLFKINGTNDSLTFTCEDGDKKLKIMNEIKKLIQKLKDQKMKKNGNDTNNLNNQQVEVNVLGTEERNSNTFNKYTVYIVEIQQINVTTKIFIRYSEMVQLEQKIKKQFRDIKVPKLEKNWLTKHKTKVIENRKILIENFLQKIFSSTFLLNKDLKNVLLDHLGLHQSFFEINDKFQNNMGSIQQEIFRQSLGNKQPTLEDQEGDVFELIGKIDDEEQKDQQKDCDCGQYQKQRTSSNCIISAEYILGQDRKILNRISTVRYTHLIQQKESQLKQQLLEVQTLDDRKLIVSANDQSRAFELREQVAQQLNIKHSLDFRLFLKDHKGNIRVLDEEEQILRIVEPMTQSEDITHKKSGFFSSIKNKFENLIGQKKEKQVLIFKKYLWLPSQIEEIDYKQDPERLKLISKQIFDEIYNKQYQLGFKEYSLFSALFLYIYYYDSIQPNNQNENFPIEKVRTSLIPPIIYNANKEVNWIDNIKHYIDSISKELEQMSKSNLQEMQTDSSIRESVQHSEIYTQKQLLAQQVVLNAIRFNSLFGVTLFHVQTYKKTIQAAKEQGIELSSSIWLGIKYDSILFLTPSRKEKTREYQLEKIIDIKVYPISIILSIESESIKEFRFNTVQSFEISQLILDYKELKKNMLKIDGFEAFINGFDNSYNV